MVRSQKPGTSLVEMTFEQQNFHLDKIPNNIPAANPFINPIKTALSPI